MKMKKKYIYVLKYIDASPWNADCVFDMSPRLKTVYFYLANWRKKRFHSSQYPIAMVATEQKKKNWKKNAQIDNILSLYEGFKHEQFLLPVTCNIFKFINQKNCKKKRNDKKNKIKITFKQYVWCLRKQNAYTNPMFGEYIGKYTAKYTLSNRAWCEKLGSFWFIFYCKGLCSLCELIIVAIRQKEEKYNLFGFCEPPEADMAKQNWPKVAIDWKMLKIPPKYLHWFQSFKLIKHIYLYEIIL